MKTSAFINKFFSFNSSDLFVVSHLMTFSDSSKLKKSYVVPVASTVISALGSASFKGFRTAFKMEAGPKPKGAASQSI